MSIINGWLDDLVGVYGPLAIGWIVAGFLAWLIHNDRKRSNPIGVYQDITKEYHQAIVEITKTLERLAILIEERTRGHDR